MTGDDDRDGDGRDGTKRRPTVVAFPYSRVRPAKSTDPEEPIIYGVVAAQLGIPAEQTTGHWCSRCGKIWYGYPLEVACPLCGNRHG